MSKTLEELYQKHLELEPEKYSHYDKSFNIGIESNKHITWRIIKEEIEMVINIPYEKRIEALKLIKLGKTCGEVGRELGVSHMAIFYLMGLNIKEYLYLSEESI